MHWDLKDGKGIIEEYDPSNGILLFDGEYLIEKEMEEEKNMKMVKWWW